MAERMGGTIAMTAAGDEQQSRRGHRTPEQLDAERALVEAAQAEPGRFALLYDRYFETVYAFALARTRQRADAEDVTAEAFQRALRMLPRFEWRGVPFSAWLLRIAANAAADLARGTERERAHSAGARAAPDGATPPPRDVEARALLFRLVDRLPGDQREVIVQRFGRDRSVEETAAAMGRSRGAVKQLQLRAVRRLREWMDDSDD